MVGLFTRSKLSFSVLIRPGGSCQGSLPSQASFIDTRTRARIRCWQTRTSDFSSAANISGSSPNKRSLKRNLTQVDSLLASGPSSSGLALTAVTSIPISSYSFTSSQVTNVFHTSSQSSPPQPPSCSIIHNGNTTERPLSAEGGIAGNTCGKDAPLNIHREKSWSFKKSDSRCCKTRNFLFFPCSIWNLKIRVINTNPIS